MRRWLRSEPSEAYRTHSQLRWLRLARASTVATTDPMVRAVAVNHRRRSTCRWPRRWVITITRRLWRRQRPPPNWRPTITPLSNINSNSNNSINNINRRRRKRRASSAQQLSRSNWKAISSSRAANRIIAAAAAAAEVATAVDIADDRRHRRLPHHRKRRPSFTSTRWWPKLALKPVNSSKPSHHRGPVCKWDSFREMYKVLFVILTHIQNEEKSFLFFFWLFHY